MSEKKIRIRAAGIVRRGDAVLLICHKKNDEEYWLLPGGGVDFGESLGEAVEREFMEELSVKVSAGELSFVSDAIDPSGDRHIVNAVFFCDHISGEPVLAEEERLHSFGWFRSDEISQLKMYPPINDQLEAIMNGTPVKKYLGRLWS